MITVYSAECFSTKMRARSTGFIAAATKIAGVFAPYSISTILTTGYPWQLSVCVGVPLLVGAVFFAKFSLNTRTYESHFKARRSVTVD
jgi:MFS family permease